MSPALICNDVLRTALWGASVIKIWYIRRGSHVMINLTVRKDGQLAVRNLCVRVSVG